MSDLLFFVIRITSATDRAHLFPLKQVLFLHTLKDGLVKK